MIHLGLGTPISLKKSDGGDNRNEESWQRGGGDNTTDDNDNHNDDKDHNNNTTIKQCMGERGAEDDGGNWQLAVGDVDDNRRDRDRP